MSYFHHAALQQSWESLPVDTATFTSDITPLVLAAHRDNYEIIKILLDRGAVIIEEKKTSQFTLFLIVFAKCVKHRSKCV